jgi:type II secretory pathway component PulF
MTRYAYTAKTGPAKTIRGDIEADSAQDAVQKITNLGYFPVSVCPEQGLLDKERGWAFPKFKAQELVLCTTQLSALVGSGVHILKALGLIAEQLPNRYLKAVLLDISKQVKDGKAFSDGLSMHPQVFPEFYVSMAHSGEASGNIEEALRRLSGYLEKEEEFRDSLRQAMIYPAFIFSVSALTIIVLLAFVIPRLVGMFSDMGQVLPLPTKILIAVSGLMRSFWWFFPAAILFIVLFLQRMKRTPQGRIALDTFRLKLPLLGNIIVKAEIGRFMRTLSLLVTGGMSIAPALEVATSTFSNCVLRQEAEKFKGAITSGSMLSEAMKGSKFFPRFSVSVISVGEETGSLGKAFLRVAGDYESEVERNLKTVARLIEPVIILVMGLIVCFIVLSMLLPIFQINLIVR